MRYVPVFACRWGGGGRGPSSRRGFTLVEILVATSITLVMLVLFFQMLGSSTDKWKRTKESAQTFAQARLAFDTIIRCLSVATLNPVYDYYNANRQARGALSESAQAAFIPDVYGRFSNLHFVSGRSLLDTSKATQFMHAIFFQAPLDFTGLSAGEPASGQLNAIGFFVREESDEDWLPTSLQSHARTRFRLYSYLQPTDKLEIYQTGGNQWFLGDINGPKPPNAPLPNIHILAENVVVFVVMPKTRGGSTYNYDTRPTWSPGTDQPETMHQLPPTVHVLMVVIDETTASRYPGVGRTANLGPHGADTDFLNLFSDPVLYASDLETVTTELDKLNANYRVFQADVQIRAARWSE